MVKQGIGDGPFKFVGILSVFDSSPPRHDTAKTIKSLKKLRVF